MYFILFFDSVKFGSADWVFSELRTIYMLLKNIDLSKLQLRIMTSSVDGLAGTP